VIPKQVQGSEHKLGFYPREVKNGFARLVSYSAKILPRSVELVAISSC